MALAGQHAARLLARSRLVGRSAIQGSQRGPSALDDGVASIRQLVRDVVPQLRNLEIGGDGLKGGLGVEYCCQPVAGSRVVARSEGSDYLVRDLPDSLSRACQLLQLSIAITVRDLS
jgi:hypothetical protein